MTELSRRDWMKTVGAASAASMLAQAATAHPLSAEGAAPPPARAEILLLSSTSEVFVPPRGRGFNKFSFDFPEPSVAFDGLRFGFIVFGRENAYAMDPHGMEAVETPDGMQITCKGFTWAGGQEKHDGTLVAQLKKTADGVDIDVSATMDQPVKTVTSIVRGVPRGKLSSSGGDFADVRDNEILLGYPFGGGDLMLAGGLTTPVAVIQSADDAYFTLSSLDDKVRTKRMYFAPGESGYKVELIHEGEGWLDQKTLRVPTWRIARTKSAEAAYAPHYEHLRTAYHFPDFDKRPDVPDWLRETALVLTLHGQHYTGYIFNDYARQLEILRWVSSQIPGKRVLAFMSSWDGRYYWDYPNYRVNDRMGGDAGFRTLISEAQKMGFRMMPMFGMNTANKKQPGWARIADAVTHKIDGDEVNLNWVDWDNDRHQEGWLGYMNLGVSSWRAHLQGRIDEMIAKYGVDAYFLDIAGGTINDTKADMHAGMKQMVSELHAKHPHVLCCGEMHYDAMLEFIPLYHSGGGPKYAKDYIQRHAKFFSHLSTPAPGRGSSGVHESGFGRFNAETLMLNPNSIPTLQIVDDTFDKHRDTMAEVIKRARERAGI
ncbi:MAG TPA: hypothetical protein VGI97_06205 [Gemmatimonadaceae bacterium]|jgi:hypothetical protein